MDYISRITWSHMTEANSANPYLTQRYGIGGTRCCSFAGNVKNTVLAVVTSRS